MSARTKISKGFTLVEILIVVVILGILAAIVIPQFTSASETAKASSLNSQLQTIRSQLELYQVQHNGNYPELADLNTTDTDGDGQDDWENLTTWTDVDGNIVAEADLVGDEFGPYLQKAPTNPFQTKSDVAANAAADLGWTYNENTGAVRGVLPDDICADIVNLNIAPADVLDEAGAACP